MKVFIVSAGCARRGAAVALLSLVFGACSARSGGAAYAPDPDAGPADVAVADQSAPVDASARVVYDRCRSGEACGGGAQCVVATFSGDGSAASLCSAPCARGEECPASARGAGFAPVCVVLAASGAGLCYDGCAANTDCGAGTLCATVPGAKTRICVPTGGSTGVPVRTPYQRCIAGDTCANSLCAAATVRVGDAPVGSFCTAACPGGAPSACPGYVAGAATQSVACLSVASAAAPQCFRLCTAASDCERDGTVCIELATATGAAVRVCAPRG